jgi:hypothetical protein
MSENNTAQELLGLEEPLDDAVGLARALHLAVDGLDNEYDRSALKAVVGALEAVLGDIEERWREMHKKARETASEVQS